MKIHADHSRKSSSFLTVSDWPKKNNNQALGRIGDRMVGSLLEFRYVLFLKLFFLLGLLTAPAAYSQTEYNRGPAAEFTHQKLVVFSFAELVPEHAKVLEQIIVSSPKQDFLILVNDVFELERATNFVEEKQLPATRLNFQLAPTDSKWIRDYGPIFVQTGGSQTEILDFRYHDDRIKDDDLPIAWAQLVGSPIIRVTLALQGGNLISNGCGIGLTTTRIYKDNFKRYISLADDRFDVDSIAFDIANDLRKSTRLDQLVVLEPLVGEPTEHVDMFATFIDAHKVVIAQLDPRVHPINAAVLDRNAKKLESVICSDGKKLQVKRLPMPGCTNDIWSSYTNILTTNDAVFIPVLTSDSRAIVNNCVRFYEKQFPGRRVFTINSDSLNRFGGSLHCISKNIPNGAKSPNRMLSFFEANLLVDGVHEWNRQILDQIPSDMRKRRSPNK